MNAPENFGTLGVSADELGAERVIVGTCLSSTEAIGESSGKVSADDFANPTLAAVYGVLVGLHSEGRKPSIESVVSVLGNVEFEPGAFLRPYLEHLRRTSFLNHLFPLADAIGVVRDVAQRRMLADIAHTLLAERFAVRSVAEIITDAQSRMDEIAAMSRQAARQTYDAGSAADAAITHLGESERTSPTTGLVDFDKMLGGWPKGELSVLAGRPGMGKSAIATTCLLRAAKARHGCMFFSLEMTARQLGARMLSDVAWTHESPIPYQDILRRNIDENATRRILTAKDFIANLPIVIEEQRGLTISDIAARARKQAAKFENDGGSLDVVFVDHMLLVRASQRYAGNRVREVAEISDGLASLAKELNCAVVALCQLNRGVEGREVKRPALSDLRDSGAIEEDASTVTFIYRPAYYLEQMRTDNEDQENVRLRSLQERRNDLELIVAKNRNGAVGIVDVFVDIGSNAVRNKVRHDAGEAH